MFKKVVLALIIMLLPLPSFSLDPPQLIGRVNDYAGLLSPQAVTGIEKKLATFERATSNQVAVLTILALDGDEVNQYALRVAREWRLGQKGKNNGLLLVVAKKERMVRVEVGIGLQDVLTDAEAGRIIREVMRPYLKEGNFDKGVNAGLDAMISATKYKFRTSYWDSWIK